MKISRIKIVFVLSVLSFLSIETVFSQEESLGSLATKKAAMYVFPANGQSDSQMEEDQTACYKWAVEQSGIDVLNPTVAKGAEVNTEPDGSGVKGAAKGALVGLAIGSISGNAGDGAAYGAIGGGLSGRRAGRHAKQQQQQANDQKANQINTENMNSFKKAYSVCLEGKGYTVK